jgi:hypothetical protein
MRSALSLALGSLAAALIAAAPADVRAERVRVAVVPFAALTGEVPVRAGSKGATLLAGELKNVGEIDSVGLAVEPDEAAAKALMEARASVAAARQLEAKRRFGAAAAAWRQALAKYEQGAAQLTDPAELSDVHVGLATVLYLTGDDAGGEQELGQALSLTPKRPFPGESTSRLFTATVAAVREKLLAAPKASLQLSSQPAGARVLLDGQELGRTPLTVRDLPPGRHLWRVLLPDSEPAGGTVMLAAGERRSVEAVVAGTSPLTRLNSLLATNRIDDAVAAQAKAVAESAGAKLLVFGALQGHGDDLVLESFLYSPATGAVSRLPARTFDAELLSAGMELFKLAGEIGARLGAPGAPEKLPGRISREPLPVATARTEVAYQLPGEGGEPQTEDPRGGRRPVDPHKTQRVLKPRDR